MEEYNALTRFTQRPPQKSPVVVILGLYDITDMGLVRCLEDYGIPLYVLSPNERILASYSKSCRTLRCPHPKDHEDEYLSFLRRLGATFKTKGILIPAADITCTVVLRHRELLEKYYVIPCPSYDIVNTFLDKHVFYKLLEKKHIPHPKTWYPHEARN